MLRLVGFANPKDALDIYPFELSGGLRQRAMIAMALICRPALLIADEPTTALDVTIQAQILKLVRDLQSEFGMALLLITHDLGVVAETCDHVVVMYAGKVGEQGTAEDIFYRPMHPYTKGLLNSIPTVAREGKKRDRLETIPGLVPSLLKLPRGCRFQDRCSRRTSKCSEMEPKLEELAPGHSAACFHPFVEGEV